MKKTPPLPDYPVFLAALKERILQARTSAARAVNRDLVLLYWDIGRGIVEKQQTAGWGEAVVERLATDLRAAFPDMRGLSSFNLWRMRQIYIEYSSPEFLAQAVPELARANEAAILRQAAAELPQRHQNGVTPFLEQAVQESVSSMRAISYASQGEILEKPFQEFENFAADKSPAILAQAVRVMIESVVAAKD